MSNYKLQITNYKLFGVLYIFLIFCLFLYSYTQVDLNLTLSQISLWQVIQKTFQQIGWFNRPLSTSIYISIIVLLTLFYSLFLWMVKNKKISVKQFWWVIGITSAILLFSYNAFSYDLFNYMFDARVVTYHNLSPYEYRALDFPNDPWIHFMRWTHRLLPYGIVWLGLTVPISFIGMQVFLPTLFMFKALAVLAFLGTTYFVGKIVKIMDPKSQLFSMAFFAFNPLVIIESLVSAHNDIVMMFLAISSLYFLLTKKYFLSILLLALSIGIKYATGLLIFPYLLIFYFQQTKKPINWDLVINMAIFLMIIATIAATIRTTFQPWYLIFIIPFASIIAARSYIVLTVFISSSVILFEYVPYLYLGNWDPPVPSIINSLTFGAILLSLFAVFLSNKVKLLKSSP